MKSISEQRDSLASHTVGQPLRLSLVAEHQELLDWAERAALFLENYFKGSVRVEPLSEEEIRANIQMATNEGLELLREIGGND